MTWQIIEPAKRELPQFTIDDVIQALDQHRSYPDTKPWRSNGYLEVHRLWPQSSSEPINVLELLDVDCSADDKEWLLMELGSNVLPPDLNGWCSLNSLHKSLLAWLNERQLGIDIDTEP